jgi:hypothetical protein
MDFQEAYFYGACVLDPHLGFDYYSNPGKESRSYSNHEKEPRGEQS